MILVLACAPLWGCVVAQAPGKGQTAHVQEPTKKGWYWLYLPEGYDAKAAPGARGPKRPLVVTFHGMKPFDNAHSQIREWQQEADRYGFIVIAPECESADLLKEFPLRTVNNTLKRDEERTVAILSDVQQRAEVDPTRVLSTSWSSGGYIAHYMANRHPDRFSCIAPRQSNFSAAILDPGMIPRYRDHKVGIFYTENDFAICREESQEGARWYTQNGFDVTFAVFKDLGHERRPSAAAAFFAETCGVEARTPPTELAHMQVKRVALPTAYPAASKSPKQQPVTVASTVSTPPQQPPPKAAPKQAPSQQERESLFANRQPSRPTPSANRPTPSQPRQQQQQAPVSPPPDRPVATTESSPLRVRLSSTIGIAPLLVTFSALTPQDLRKDAYFLWLADGQPIANGMTGQKYLTSPGRHQLECVLTTADGREYRAYKNVTVLERVTTSATSAASDHP
jgi:predicted esterase